MMQTFFVDFFMLLLKILPAIGAFLVVIGVHELGHFFMARCLGVGVLRLSLGFGKPIWKRKSKKGIEYGISPFLLGGYVRLLDEREESVPPELLSKSMTRQPAWKRFCILSAGPLMNFIFATILFILVLSHGLPVLKPVVGEVIASSLAEKTGFQKGDIFLSVKNHPVSNWLLVHMYLIEAFGEKGRLSIEVQHPDTTRESLDFPLSQWKLNALNPNLLISLGVRPSLKAQWMRTEKEKFFQAITSSLIYVTDYARLNGIIAYKMVRGILSIRSLGGPISIFTASVESVKKGWVYYCFFLGFLSVSVGAFNLLPIPGLDGFQMLIVFIEKITRRSVSTALQVLLYQLGLIALSLLMVQVVLNDLARYGKFF